MRFGLCYILHIDYYINPVLFCSSKLKLKFFLLLFSVYRKVEAYRLDMSIDENLCTPSLLIMTEKQLRINIGNGVRGMVYLYIIFFYDVKNWDGTWFEY